MIARCATLASRRLPHGRVTGPPYFPSTSKQVEQQGNTSVFMDDNRQTKFGDCLEHGHKGCGLYMSACPGKWDADQLSCYRASGGQQVGESRALDDRALQQSGEEVRTLTEMSQVSESSSPASCTATQRITRGKAVSVSWSESDRPFRGLKVTCKQLVRLRQPF